MIIEYVAALSIAAIVGAVVWNVPNYARATKERWLAFDQAQAEFFEHATALVSDRRTPEKIIAVMALLSDRLDDPRIMRRIVFAALRGRLRADFENPTNDQKDVVRSMKALPDDLGPHFSAAMSSALMANALASGWFGWMFLNLIFADPQTRPQTATHIVAEPTFAYALAV